MQDTQNRYYGVFAFTLALTVFIDGRLTVACFLLLCLHGGCRAFLKQIWEESYGSLKESWNQHRSVYLAIPLLAILYVNLAVIYTEVSRSIPFLNTLVELAESIFADATILQVVILAPILEEIIFRRIYLQYFNKRFSDTTSCVLVSIGFATLHPHNLIPTFLLSYTFCVFVIKTKSLWPSTVAHFAINAVVFLLPMLLSTLDQQFATGIEYGLYLGALLVIYYYFREKVDYANLLRMPVIQWSWRFGTTSKQFLTVCLCIFVIGSALAIQVKYLDSKKILSKSEEKYNLNLIAIQQTHEVKQYTFNNFMTQRAYHFACTGDQPDQMTCKVLGMKVDWSQPSSEEPKVFKQNCEVEVATPYRLLKMNKITENLWSGKGHEGTIVKIDLEKHAVVINDWYKKKDVDYVVLESEYEKEKPKLKRGAQTAFLGAGKQTKVSWDKIQLHEYQSTKRKHYFLNTKHVFGCVVSNVVVTSSVL